MQLNVTTDYGVRIVVYLAQVDGLATRQEISQAMGIPISSMSAITKNLQKDGLIMEKRGRTGGFKLAKSPDEITLGMIIRALERTMQINRCLEDDHFCSRKATKDCPVRRHLLKIQNALNSMLDINITELIA